MTGLTATTTRRLVRARCEGGPLDGRVVDAPAAWTGHYIPTVHNNHLYKRGTGRYLLAGGVWRWVPNPYLRTG